MSEQQNKKTFRNDHKRQFCTFHLANRFFGIDILDVKEIIDEITVTKIHHAPDEMFGFINVRGHVYLILDLRLILNFAKKEIDKTNRVLLFTQRVGESFGILIDRIDHMVEVFENQIEYRVHDKKSDIADIDENLSKLAIGTCKLEKLMIILDSTRFLNHLKK